MNFVDRMFLLWYATPAMAAALPAGMLHFVIICFPLGVASYVNTFVAQYYGAGRPERIGTAVWQGVWVGLLTAPLFLLTIPLAPAVFEWAGHDPQIAALESIYFRTVAFGGGASVLAAALSSFFTGRGETRVVMLVDSISSLLNVVLDYAWIFGHWGFPEAGIAGAAWATVVAQWSRVLMYALILARPKYRSYRFASSPWIDPVLWRRLWRYGGPNGWQFLVDVAAFTLFLLLVGRLGTLAAAATTLAFNVNSIAFVPMIGLGIAVSTLVGQQLGRNREDLAARATWTAFAMAACYMGLLSLLYVLVPDWFLIGHAAGAKQLDEFARLRDLTVVLLRFVAVYSLFDAMNLTFVGALKGAGDTRFVLWVNALMAPLPLLLGWWGTTYWEFGMIWCWSVLTAWACGLGAIFLVRFVRGKWRTMRVIEPEWEELDSELDQSAVSCSVDTP